MNRLGLIRFIIITLGITVFLMGCGAKKTAPTMSAPPPRQPDVVSLTAVQISDGSVQLLLSGLVADRFSLAKPADPYVVVFDMPGIAKATTKDFYPSTSSGISSVKVEELKSPSTMTRVTVQLEQPSDMEYRMAGAMVTLEMPLPKASDSMPGSGSAQSASSESNVPVPADAMGPATSVNSIGFQKEGQFVRMVIKGNGSMTPAVLSFGNKIVVDIPNVKMATAVPTGAPAPVKDIRFGAYEGSTRIVVELDDELNFTSSTQGDSIVLHIPVSRKIFLTKKESSAGGAPEVTAVEASTKPNLDAVAEKRIYSDKLISLDFQNADIVPIFRLLGEVANYNTVIHPKVAGTITLKLVKVPWDHALQLILELSNLDKSVEGNILKIAPSDVFSKQKEDIARLKQAEVKVAPLVQFNYQLKYIQAASLKKRLDEVKALSPRGTMRVDERTSTIIINDTEDSIKKIAEEEIPFWDTPDHGTLQVLIEARLVQVRTGHSQTLGIRWGGTATDDNFSFINKEMSFGVSVNTPVGAGGAAADVSGGLLSIGYTDTFNMNLSLEALETLGHSKTIANPRVLTLDRQKANITQGSKIPYVVQSADGPNTKLETAALTLDVTPEVQPNDLILLDVKVDNNAPGESYPAGVAIETQSIQTNALVKNGKTLVLGGIYSKTESASNSMVPVLGRIPFLGWLFKTKTEATNQTELLIFITPKIIKTEI